MEKDTVLVIGDINIDLALHAEKYPPEGGEAHADQAGFRLGGSGCATAVCLSLLGLPTALAANLGDDLFADFALEHMRASGLDDSLVRRLPGQQTGFFMILVTPDGGRTMFGGRGANRKAPEREALLERLPHVRHLHVSGYTLQEDGQHALVREAVEKARGLGLTLSLDPGVCASEHNGERLRGLLRLVDWFLPSREELALLYGSEDIEKGIADMLALGCGAVALKLGADGSRYDDGETRCGAPAVMEPGAGIIDTTCAGDCFNAGFLQGVLAGEAPGEALRMGGKAAFRLITAPRGLISLIHDS